MWILVRARLSALIHTPTWVHMHTSSPELAPQESAVSLLSFCHLRTLAEVADILEPRGLQEEAEVPAQIDLHPPPHTCTLTYTEAVLSNLGPLETQPQETWR